MGRRSSVDCTKTIRSELGHVETLGISKPGPAALLAHDLDIWVSQAKTARLILGNQSWKVLDEFIGMLPTEVLHCLIILTSE